MREKVLVAGGKGFIGSHLVNYLAAKGYHVRSVDIHNNSYLPSKEDEFMLLDLRRRNKAMKATNNIDWVFNLAANMGGIGYIREYNASIMRDNALININILEASRSQHVERIFFSSSACAYPRFLQTEPNNPGLTESDVLPAYPDSSYGWEKLFSEIVYKSYMVDYGLKVRLARFQNVYGEYCEFNNGREKYPAAICRKIAEAKDGGAITVWGDGKQTRSYVYISDCLNGFYRLMLSEYSEPVNIGTAGLISVDDLARLVMRVAGKSLRIEHDLTMPQGVRGRCANIELARRVLGWEPKVPLEVGMTRLYRWVHSQIVRG